MRISARIAIASAALLCSINTYAYDGRCESIQDVTDLPPGHWCEVPNSKLESAEKKPSEFEDWDGNQSAAYNSFQRVQGVRAVTETWNSAAVDTKRGCLLVTGGGHNDYGGNEIYRFCLDTLAWARVSDPTPYPSRHPEFANVDGTPVSRHTYDGLAYLPAVDRLFMFDGSPDHGPGTCGVRGTWTFNLLERDATGVYSPEQWELRTTENEPERQCDNTSAFDSRTDRVIFKTTSGTYAFDLSANAWSKLSGDGRRNQEVNIEIDPNRNLLVEVGGGVTALWSMANGFEGGPVQTTGDSEIADEDDPGLVYDSRVDRIVAWHGGPDVYLLNPSQKVWTRISPAAENLVDPGKVETFGGVFGRFNYFPKQNVYIYVDRTNKNVFLYRLSDSDVSQPLPPSSLTPD